MKLVVFCIYLKFFSAETKDRQRSSFRRFVMIWVSAPKNLLEKSRPILKKWSVLASLAGRFAALGFGLPWQCTAKLSRNCSDTEGAKASAVVVLRRIEKILRIIRLFATKLFLRNEKVSFILIFLNGVNRGRILGHRSSFIFYLLEVEIGWNGRYWAILEGAIGFLYGLWPFGLGWNWQWLKQTQKRETLQFSTPISKLNCERRVNVWDIL